MTGIGLYAGYRGDKWYRDRIKIFARTCLSSLDNQSNLNFLQWISFREAEKFNPLTEKLAFLIHDTSIRFQDIIFTFAGQPYWDDKCDPGIKNRTLNIARTIRNMLRRPQFFRNPVILFKEMMKDKNATLEQRIEESMKILRKYWHKEKWVYFSRCDSDDMLHKDFLKEVITFKPEYKKAIIAMNGYVYDIPTNRLGKWIPETQPPFHTIIFPAEIFFNAKRHLAYLEDFKSHEDIPRLFNCERMSDGKYCITTHSGNISTIFNHPWRGEEITINKDKILADFGLK